MDPSRRIAEEYRMLLELIKEENKVGKDKRNLYVFDAVWICSYKEYLSKNRGFMNPPPGRIDNRNLERKARLNTITDNDYFSVLEDCARFMLMLYGGGPVMTVYNIEEMVEESKRKHLQVLHNNSSSAQKNAVLEDLSIHQSLSNYSDTSSSYNRPKKTKSLLEQRYADPKGWVLASGHQLLDESSSIYNCKHQGDVPAEMEDENFHNPLNLLIKKEIHRKLINEEFDKSAEKPSDTSEIAEIAGIMFKEALQKYIDKHKSFGKDKHIHFSMQSKQYIHTKLVETLEELTSIPIVQEPDPLANLYNYSDLEQMEQMCNGLENPHCYCYLNSVLQFLFSIKELVYYFHRDPEDRVKNKKTGSEFKKVVDEYQGKQFKKLDATPLLQCFRSKLQVNLQQDVDELLRLLLDQLQQELKPQTKRAGVSLAGKSAWINYCIQENSILTYLFTGETKRRTVCLNCQHASEITETFDILSLSLAKENKNLEDVLASNFDCELIDEGFQCSACKRLAPATSKLFLTRLPRYLILQLKRFSVFPKPCKVSQEISYGGNVHLDLQRFSLSSPTKYELTSAVHHSGSITDGHYRVSGLRNNKVSNVQTSGFYLMMRRCTRAVRPRSSTRKHIFSSTEDSNQSSAVNFHSSFTIKNVGTSSDSSKCRSASSQMMMSRSWI